jgi:hypothetical protein
VLRYFLILFLFPYFLFGVEFNYLKKSLPAITNNAPFDYSLNIVLLKGKTANSNVMLAFHGYGGDFRIGPILHSHGDISDHLISFNFPDHNVLDRQLSINQLSFGTIKELLPPIYILKKLAVDLHVDKIDLYGFSGGGGALINVLAVLNSAKYDTSLEKIGISKLDKKAILEAVQKGWVLLDSPLKSIPELIDFRGNSLELDALLKQYSENLLVPIDNLEHLKGLNLNVLVYFENPDEVLSNSDDKLFAQKLMQANPNGKNIIIESNSGGHMRYHKKLFDAFNQQFNR